MMTIMACGSKTETTPPTTDAATDSASDGAGDAPIDSTPSDGGDASSACFDEAGTEPSDMKACSIDADCTTGKHELSCCGSMVIVGVTKTRKAAYDACEAAWDKHFPACGCPSAPDVAEDGKQVSAGTLEVHCVDFSSSGGFCKTIVK